MKLSEAYWKQKLEMHIVFNKDKLTRSKPLSGNSNALNLCKIDISKILNTMHIFIHNQILSMFHDLVQRPDHKYLASFSNSSFYFRNYSLNSTRYSISILGSKSWKFFIKKEEKHIYSYFLFLRKIKSKQKVKSITSDETLITSN